MATVIYTKASKSKLHACWHILVVMCVSTLRTTGAFFPSLGGFFRTSINTLITLKWLRLCNSKQEPNSGIRPSKWLLSNNATSEQQGDGSHTQFVCAICGGIFLMHVFFLCAISVVFSFCFQVYSILLKASLSLLLHSYYAVAAQKSDSFSLSWFIFYVKKVRYSLLFIQQSIFCIKTCSDIGHGWEQWCILDACCWG